MGAAVTRPHTGAAATCSIPRAFLGWPPRSRSKVKEENVKEQPSNCYMHMFF